MTTQVKDSINICCPELLILDCAETKEHKHLVCGFSNTIIQNNTVKDLCIGERFNECINNRMEAE